MILSPDLVSQFVKATSPKKDTKKETIVYGTVVISDEITYVKMDGSEMMTPVVSTADVKNGERVTVMIKDHRAIITGNKTSPAARTDDVKEVATEVKEVAAKVAEYDVIIAGKVSTETLEAEVAKINEVVAKKVDAETLEAEVATINQVVAKKVDTETFEAEIAEIDKVIAGKVSTELLDAAVARISKLEADSLTADSAVITELQTKKLDATVAEVTYATIDSLNAERARISTLETDSLTANSAVIKALQADKLDASTANITYATIKQLDAEKARITTLEANSLTANSAVITDLQAGVADIDTLIFGSATGSVIQTSFANAVIAQLGDAQIKSAMIDEVSASKIKSGDILTNNVRVMSEDGKLIISDETIQISDDTRVRVQIGKDASNDYSINVWNADGELIFSEGGITDKAITSAIIRNDMVADNANISAGKLDIDSLFDEINGSSKTIKSTRIYLDEDKQTLDVAFKSMTTEVSDLGTTVSSQGTAISAIQGQITSKIWQQDIDTATDAMSTQYSTLEQDLGSFKTTVGKTYATIEDFNSLEIGGRNLILNSATILLNGSDDGNSYSAVIENDYVKIVPVNDGNIYNNGGIKTSIPRKQGVEYTLSFEILSPTKIGFYWYPNEHYTKNYYIPASESWQKVKFTYTQTGADSTSGFLFGLNGLTAGETYYYRNLKLETGNMATAWTPAPEDLELDVSSLADRLSTAETVIDQNTADILLRATTTEVATAKSEAITSANKNTTDLLKSYSTTEQMNAAINVKADSITSTVSQTYTTKAEFNDLTIGGRNLFSGYDDTEFELPSYRDTGSFKQFSNLTIDAADYVGKEFTISFWAKSPNGSTQLQLYNRNGDPRYFAFNAIIDDTLGDEWEYYSYTFTNVDRGEDYTAVHNRIEIYAPDQTGVLVKKIKVEMGNRATDWTPAPEDIDSKIESVESSVLTVTQTATDLTTRLETVEHVGTDYMNFSSSGLIVGNMIADTLGNNVLIDSDSVDIRNGETILARFSTNQIDLGIYAEESFINLCGGKGKIYIEEFGRDNERLGLYGPAMDLNSTDGMSLSACDPEGGREQYAEINLDYSTDIDGNRTSPYISLDVVHTDGSYAHGYKRSFIEIGVDSIRLDSLYGDIRLDSGDDIELYTGQSYGDFDADGTYEYKYVGNFRVYSANLHLTEEVLDLSGILSVSGDTTIGGKLTTAGSVYIPNNQAFYSYNTSGASRLLMNLNTNNNLVIGYGGYSNSEGLTNIYGNGVTITAKDTIDLKGPVTFTDAADTRTNLGVWMYDITTNATYPGLARPDGTTTGYVRTPQTGIIPYQNGGHGTVGTSSWPFKNGYFKNIDVSGVVINDSSNIVMPNAKALYSKATDDTALSLIYLNNGNNTIVGYGGYIYGKGSTHIYGNDAVKIFSKKAGASFKPYYEAGDSFEIELHTAGYCTSTCASVYFVLPLDRPVIGDPTVAIASVKGLVLRQNEKYTHGSAYANSALKYVTPESGYVSYLKKTCIVVRANFTTVTNATNNNPLAVTASISVTFS